MTGQLWNILTKGIDEIVVLGLALLVILRLGTLAIDKYFEYLKSITPFQERLVIAVEQVAGVAERFEQKITREQQLISTSIRALWDEWEAQKLADSKGRKREEAA